MESLELGRKLKRNCENILSKKRLALVVIASLVTFVYILPYLLKWYRTPTLNLDNIDLCLYDRISSFNSESEQFNVHIVYDPPKDKNKEFAAYLGNGYFGIDVLKDQQIYVKNGRYLSQPLPIFPVYTLKTNIGSYRSASVVNYLTGVVHAFQCYENGFYSSIQYLVHRRLPTLFIQDVKLSNPTDRSYDVTLQLKQSTGLHASSTRTVEIGHGENVAKYNLTSGYINIDNIGSYETMSISLIYRNAPINLRVEARSARQTVYYTAISYSSSKNAKSELERIANEEIKKVLIDDLHWRNLHAKSWQQLWTTGFAIETSKAQDVLNGDKINATLYYVLSQVKEESDVTEVATRLSYAEGCYGNHHTLEATNLWGDLSSVTAINQIVSYWLLTLEKNGCHNMLRAGAKGVVEAMVLSFGGLRFSNQHLEFNIDPKYLHRDYLFHRLAYGNRTHVNISVVVQEDNKAVLRVALDRSDKDYYACDAGCLDEPVLLGPQLTTFPIKLTEPLTPILYITYDKQHMEELRKAIHVREIGEAPAHDNHVIALHKHGHHLGGLPTFFWVSVSILILIFHLFLFKLVYNEYCSGGSFDRQRFRYGKL